jgi:hypothetical protein
MGAPGRSILVYGSAENTVGSGGNLVPIAQCVIGVAATSSQSCSLLEWVPVRCCDARGLCAPADFGARAQEPTTSSSGLSAGILAMIIILSGANSSSRRPPPSRAPAAV